MNRSAVLVAGAAAALTLGLLAPSVAQPISGARPASAQNFTTEAAALRRQSTSLAAETERLGAAATIEARAQSLRQQALAAAQSAVAEAETAAAQANSALAADQAALEALITQAYFARAAGASPVARTALRLAAAEAAHRAAPRQSAAQTALAVAARRRAAAAVLAQQVAAGEQRLADAALRLSARSNDHAEILDRLALVESRAQALRRDPQGAGQAAPRLAAALFGPGGARTVLGATQARPGVVYAGAPGQRVIAPERGEVSFAGPLRGYGQVLIVEFDSGYTLVFAGLDQVNSAVGDNVETGAVIGAFSSSAAVAPELYVEVRRSARPVDPERAARSWTVAAIGDGLSGARP